MPGSDATDPSGVKTVYKKLLNILKKSGGMAETSKRRIRARSLDFTGRTFSENMIYFPGTKSSAAHQMCSRALLKRFIKTIMRSDHDEK